MMIQVADRIQQTTRAGEACGDAVPWPCDNDVVASFPLQVINQFVLLDETTPKPWPVMAVEGRRRSRD